MTKSWYLAHREETIAKATAWNKANPERRRATVKRYNDAHREGRQEYFKEYRAVNREKIAARMKKYCFDNAKTINARSEVWRKANPEKHAARQRQRRARKLEANGDCTIEQWMARVDFHGWACVYCGKKLTIKTLECDHQIPLSRGGTDWPANLVPACCRCNRAKHTRTPLEYVA